MIWQRFKAPANGYVLERRAWLSYHSHIGICAFSAGAYLRQVLDDEVSRSAEQLLYCRSSRPESKNNPGVLKFKALPCEHYAHTTELRRVVCGNDDTPGSQCARP